MAHNADVERIAEALVANCREGKERDNLDAFYAEDAVSVEAMAPPGEDREKKGRAAIHAKHDWWEGAMEPLESSLQGPFYDGGGRFSVIFALKVKERASGNVVDMQEVALYTVEGGKIVREEFFYDLTPPS
ncbi:MAG: nuclear transport factor 2 family protein [Pseudomonadota bacterium]